jgi:hypothetical protein
MGKNLFFLKMFLHCSVRTKKEKLKKVLKNLESIFLGLKAVFFRASCFGLFWF